MSHKDYFGKEIKAGDYVVYSSYGGSSGFSGVFEVTGLTPKKVRAVRVGGPAPSSYRSSTTLFPETILVVTEQYLKSFPEILDRPNG